MFIDDIKNIAKKHKPKIDMEKCRYRVHKKFMKVAKKGDTSCSLWLPCGLNLDKFNEYIKKDGIECIFLHSDNKNQKVYVSEILDMDKFWKKIAFNREKHRQEDNILMNRSNMRRINMKKEDIRFLKELQHEMLTQDTVGQADPRFWVVMQKVRKYGIDIDYHEYDGEVLIGYDGEVVAENLDELYEFVKEREKGNDFVICKVDDYLKITKTIYDIDYYIYTLTDFYDMMDEINFDCINVAYYKEEYEIVKSTMFLTLKECKRHIKNNSYHYNNPIPYAMTAWRSPQVEKLYKILQNTDWDDLED